LASRPFSRIGYWRSEFELPNLK